jgi:hypothetical protein
MGAAVSSEILVTSIIPYGGAKPQISVQVISLHDMKYKSDFIKDTVLWNVAPYSLIEFQRSFGEKYYLHLQGHRVWEAIKQAKSKPTFLPASLFASSVYYSTVMTEAVFSSEIYANSCQATVRHIPEDSTLHSH